MGANEGGGEEVEGEEEEEDLEEDSEEDLDEDPMEEHERRQFYFDLNNTWEEEVWPEEGNNPNVDDRQEDLNQHHASREAMEVDGLPITNEKPNDDRDPSWRNVYLIDHQGNLQEQTLPANPNEALTSPALSLESRIDTILTELSSREVVKRIMRYFQQFMTKRSR